MKIGIICAIPEEGRHILDEMEVTRVVQKIKTRFYEGSFMGLPVVVVISGMGKVSSALSAQILLELFQVDLVIFSGIAGGLNPELNIGDTVIATETLFHDVDRAGEGIDMNTLHSFFRNRFKTDMPLLEILQHGLSSFKLQDSSFLTQVRKGVPTQIYFGRILTGDQVITSSTRVKYLREELKGDCVEMEGAAIAQTCTLYDRPYLIIRTISDLADEVAMKTVKSSMESVVVMNYQVLKAVLRVISNSAHSSESIP